MSTQKAKALELALGQIDREFGHGNSFMGQQFRYRPVGLIWRHSPSLCIVLKDSISRVCL